MSVIYYSSNDNEPALRFQKIIMMESKEEKIERYKSLEELSNRLRQSNLENNVAILFISDIAEIYQICLMKNLLNDIRIILILPDRSAEMISAAFKLYPRFISYIDSDFKDEIVVLKRMIKQVATN